jgi:hypothetical protein
MKIIRRLNEDTDNGVMPVNDIKMKDFEFYTVKHNWNKIFEQNFKGVDTEKLIPDFPVNKEIPFDKNKMIKAIEFGMIVQIQYKGLKDKWLGGRWRTIAPMVMGINKNTGNLLIRAFHLDGYSVKERKNTKKVWRLFIGTSIKKMSFSGDFFRLPPKGYKMNDRVMTETTIARADFNKIRKNQYKLVQLDKIQKAEDTELVKKEEALALAIEIQNTNTVLDLKNPWANTQYMNKKMAKEIKLTFMKSVFGNEFIAVFGALGTPGRTVKIFENKKLLGSYKTIQSFLASEIHYKKQISGQSEFKLFTFVKKL